MSNLACHIIDAPMDPTGHTHPYAHILLPLKETLRVELDRQEYYLTSQMLGFVAPGRYHHCFCASEIIIMNIPESMIKKGDLEVLEQHTCIPLEGNLIPLAEIIREEVARNPDSDSLRYLYYYLYGKLVETTGIKSLCYIREHFSEEISVANLAKLENYNISYFTEWFKRQTGCSPAQYLRSVRIEKAKELLSHTNYRMIEIAVQVGYNSNAAFTRAFKESEGISPITYRQQIQNNNE